MKELVWKNVWQAAVAVAFLCAAWLIAYWSVGNELLIPSPWRCLQEGGRLLGEPSFWRGLFGSLLRAFLAFGISFAFALVFALVAYTVPSFAGFFTPVAAALRSLPVMATLLILLFLFDGASAPVAVAFLSLFPMLYTGLYTAFTGVDERLIATARIYGATRFRRITRVYLPLSAPHILREVGGGASFALKLVISAEVLVGTAQSLGGMMQEARLYTEVATLFALVGTAFFLGLLSEMLFTAWAAVEERKMGRGEETR